jgi:hypothetical protein
MLWFLRGPLDIPVLVLIGPSTGGIIGSLGWFLVALPIFLIPGALAPTAGPQPERGASTSSTLEGSRV